MYRISTSELNDKAYQIRWDLIELIYRAKSGHLDTSLALVEVWLGLVYSDSYRFDPKNGDWVDRDRIFLSEGHACPIQYLVNSDLGYYPKEEVFEGIRRPKSHFQGHTIRNLKYGFENSNGSLGIGLWQAYGAALELQSRVFCIVGDGEMQEPSSLGLLSAPHNLAPCGNFTLIVNNNGLAQDAKVDIGPLGLAAKAWGWSVIEADGHDWASIDSAYRKAVSILDVPKMIIFKTVKGMGGDPEKAGKLGNHGKPPANEAEVAAYVKGLEAQRVK